MLQTLDVSVDLEKEKGGLAWDWKEVSITPPTSYVGFVDKEALGMSGLIIDETKEVPC